jgi:hypothetical protein
MIGLLKKLKGSNSCIFEQPKVVDCLRGKVYIHATDFSGANLRVIDGLESVEDVREALLGSSFSGDNKHSFMSLANEDASFFLNLFLCLC